MITAIFGVAEEALEGEVEKHRQEPSGKPVRDLQQPRQDRVLLLGGAVTERLPVQILGQLFQEVETPEKPLLGRAAQPLCKRSFDEQSRPGFRGSGAVIRRQDTSRGGM